MAASIVIKAFLLASCFSLAIATVTTAGDVCEFPFKYDGKEYKTCTTVNNGNKLWCATTYDYAKDRKWGYCKPATVTTAGDVCEFPFKYDGKEYKTCTTVNNGNKLWCATTYDYAKDRKWGYCKPATAAPVVTTPPIPADKCPDVDADFQGNDLKLVLDVADWKACASTCKANGACAAFSYVQKTLCCYLKTGNTNRVVKTGVISGSSNCPVTVTVAGDECAFPFKYGGQEYKSCTSINSSGNTLWCATTYDYGKDRKWGYCKLDTI